DPSSLHAIGPSALSHSFFCYTPATTELYTLSLHDALPILDDSLRSRAAALGWTERGRCLAVAGTADQGMDDLRAVELRRAARRRSEEHTSELQSRENLVCRLLLEKKNTTTHDLPT